MIRRCKFPPELPVLLLLSGMVVLAFWKPVFHSDFTLLAGNDMCAQSYPWFSAASYWLKRGVFLFWDPYVFSGKANLGELQPAILYPLNWLVYLLPGRNGAANTDAMQALILLHFVMAAWFTFLLARSFGLSRSAGVLAGISFALGGYTRQVTGYLNIFCGFVWMPLILYCYRRALDQEQWRGRAAMLVGASSAMGLSLLAGHHVPAVHSGLLLACYTLFHFLLKRSEGRAPDFVGGFLSLALVPLGVVLLTAIQWVPSLEWATQAVRWVGTEFPIGWGEKIPYEVLGRTGNLSPQDTFSLLFPYLSTSGNLYTGPVVLFLGGIALLYLNRPESRFFGILSLVFLFAGWGFYSAIHGWINTFVPGAWFAREVFHYLVPFQLCLSLLAAWGLDGLGEAYRSVAGAAVRRLVGRSIWAVGYLGITVFGVLMAARFVAKLPFSHVYLRSAGLVAVTTFLLGGLLFFLHTRRLRPVHFRALIVVLVFFDFTSRISEEVRSARSPRESGNPAVKAFWKEPPILGYLLRLREQEVFRVDDPERILQPNFGDVWRIESTMGHGATMLHRYLDFRGLGWSPTSNATSLLNTRYFVARGAIPGLTKVAGQEEGVFRNPRAVPRAFLPNRYRLFEDERSLLDWLSTPLFSPGETLLVVRDEFLEVPEGIRSAMVDEDEGISIRLESSVQEADRLIASSSDEKVRLRASALGLPWGWSPGDEATVVMRSDTAIPRATLWVAYYPQESAGTSFQCRVESGGIIRIVEGFLEGLSAGGNPEEVRYALLSLGPIATGEGRLTLVRTETCTARLDSFRVLKSPPLGEPGKAGRVQGFSMKPGRVRVDVEMERPGMVVLSELAYPGWVAEIDGSPFPIVEVDGVLQAVPVPAGKHQIRMRYRPSGFGWTAMVSCGSILGVACVGFIWRRRVTQGGPAFPFLGGSDPPVPVPPPSRPAGPGDRDSIE